jgi:hypothetical protein
MKKALYLIVVIGVLISACGPSAEELVPTYVAQTAVAQGTATEEYKEAISFALTSTAAAIPPTITPRDTSTPTVTATMEPSPTAEPMAEVTQDTAFIREGPGPTFKSTGQSAEGDTYPVLGINEEGTWVQIQIGFNRTGWLPLNAVTLNVDPESLPLVEAPSAPPETTVTFSIINKAQRKLYLLIFDSNGALVKQLILAPDKETAFQLQANYYLLVFGLGNACANGIWVDFSHDILWMPNDYLQCGVFP